MERRRRGEQVFVMERNRLLMSMIVNPKIPSLLDWLKLNRRHEVTGLAGMERDMLWLRLL